MKLPEFFQRQRIVPFETTFAFFCMYTGVSAIVRLGISNNFFERVTGRPLSVALNIALIISGVCIYVGIGKGNGRLETFGLTTISSSLLARIVGTVWFLGPTLFAINLCIFNGAFILACQVRRRSILARRVLIEAQGGELRRE